MAAPMKSAEFGFVGIILAISVLLIVSSKTFAALFDKDSEDLAIPSIPLYRNRPQRTLSESQDVKLQIYCYAGETRKVGKLWTTATVKILVSGDYQLFKGPNATSVSEQYNQSRFSLFNFLPWKTEEVKLEPFNKSCLGVATKASYTLDFRVKGPTWLVLYLVFGLVLFFSAKRLSKNIVFYYASGISIGLIASLLIVIFILSRFVPKKSGALVILLSGWSLSLYFIQYLWENIQTILETHSQYVIGYFTVAGLFTFTVLYWRGPVTDHRSLNLIKWLIQLCSLVLIYNGTQIQEVSLSVIVITVTFHNFPRSIVHWLYSVWKRRFPPKIRLCTEDEFMQEADEYTREALKGLREYCRSPNCDAWKTISRLNTPQRFASFIEGESHITDAELLDYDSDPAPTMPSFSEDDESELDFALNSP